MSFNPRARKERDDDYYDNQDIAEHVSIHAPVKSATLLSLAPRFLDARFNPRARKERDACCGAFFRVFGVFQSTRP